MPDTDQNSLNTVDLDLEEGTDDTSILDNQPSGGTYNDTISNIVLDKEPSTNILSAPKYTAPTPSVSTDQKIICFDTEATGTDPWDYRFLVCSFWDLSKPISEMVTFADWDEYTVISQIAEYLNNEKPAILVCYNNGYDQRALLTRFMLYQIKVPGWNSIKYVDMMDVLKKGTTQNIYSSQGTGTEEQWLKYFFDEVKPFTIEECFEGVRAGDLTRLIIRNRTCVESEGNLYLLFRYVTDAEGTPEYLEKPTYVDVQEAAEQGIANIVCPACNATNTVEMNKQGIQCWRCLALLPPATEENRLKEVTRPFDETKVGLKATTTTKTTTAKAKTTTKKA